MTALLDDLAARQGGDVLEGEAPAPICPQARLALDAWNHLATGMGGIDWQGLPVVVELLGVADAQLELLLHRLKVIKTHRPAQAGVKG